MRHEKLPFSAKAKMAHSLISPTPAEMENFDVESPLPKAPSNACVREKKRGVSSFCHLFSLNFRTSLPWKFMLAICLAKKYPDFSNVKIERAVL